MHFGAAHPRSHAEELDTLLTGTFDLVKRQTDGFEGSVEADPRVTTPAHLDLLRRHGFTRLSLGVQDSRTRSAARETGFSRSTSPDARRPRAASGYESVNCDLIYGCLGRRSRRCGRRPTRCCRFDRIGWPCTASRACLDQPQQRKFRDDQIRRAPTSARCTRRSDGRCSTPATSSWPRPLRPADGRPGPRGGGRDDASQLSGLHGAADHDLLAWASAPSPRRQTVITRTRRSSRCTSVGSPRPSCRRSEPPTLRGRPATTGEDPLGHDDLPRPVGRCHRGG